MISHYDAHGLGDPLPKNLKLAESREKRPPAIGFEIIINPDGSYLDAHGNWRGGTPSNLWSSGGNWGH